MKILFFICNRPFRPCEKGIGGGGGVWPLLVVGLEDDFQRHPDQLQENRCSSSVQRSPVSKKNFNERAPPPLNPNILKFSMGYTLLR